MADPSAVPSTAAQARVEEEDDDDVPPPPAIDKLSIAVAPTPTTATAVSESPAPTTAIAASSSPSTDAAVHPHAVVAPAPLVLPTSPAEESTPAGGPAGVPAAMVASPVIHPLRLPAHPTTPAPGSHLAALEEAAGINATKLLPKDFTFGRQLGEGAFAQVLHAIRNSDQQAFACKKVDKAFIQKMGKVQTVMNEKRILTMLHGHVGVVKLAYTFQDSTSLYYVMELAPGGEMFSDIKKHGRYPLPLARFYAAELVEILYFMHSRGICHRDLKPENVLFTSDYHLKVTDFGTAKKLIEDSASAIANAKRRGSFVGTAEYVSPEILRDRPSTTAADMWSLGCLLYQMLVGKVPFRGPSEYITFQKILRGKLVYPKDDTIVDENARDLLEKLLCKDVTKRLGATLAGYAELRAHPFFKDIEWSTLFTQAVPERPSVPFVITPDEPDPADDQAALEYKEEGDAGYGRVDEGDEDEDSEDEFQARMNELELATSPAAKVEVPIKKQRSITMQFEGEEEEELAAVAASAQPKAETQPPAVSASAPAAAAAAPATDETTSAAPALTETTSAPAAAADATSSTPTAPTVASTPATTDAAPSDASTAAASTSAPSSSPASATPSAKTSSAGPAPTEAASAKTSIVRSHSTRLSIATPADTGAVISPTSSTVSSDQDDPDSETRDTVPAALKLENASSSYSAVPILATPKAASSAGSPLSTVSDSSARLWSGFLHPKEHIVFTGLVTKRRSFFARKRQLILTDTPRLFYVDPDSMKMKKEVEWSSELWGEIIDDMTFYIHTPKRDYYMRGLTSSATSWVKHINDLQERAKAAGTTPGAAPAASYNEATPAGMFS